MFMKIKDNTNCSNTINFFDEIKKTTKEILNTYSLISKIKIELDSSPINKKQEHEIKIFCAEKFIDISWKKVNLLISLIKQ